MTFSDGITIQENFTLNNRASVGTKFQALSVSGGGSNEPEPSDEALNTVVNALPAAGRPQNVDFTPPFRAEALKIIILVTDARPGGFDDTYTPGVDDVNAHNRALEAGAQRINISAVFVPTGFSPPDHPAVRSIMQYYATTTDGMFIETASNGVGTGNAMNSIIARCGTGLVDGDRDSIPDDIEEHGYDYNHDGIVDVNLPAMGAKKDHKDIFVYIDWIEKSSGVDKHSHKPGNDSINKVKEAFANAPVYNYLDDTTGINLHVIFGNKIEETEANKELGSFIDGCKYNWNEFDLLKNRNIDGFPASMRPIFHYVIFAHDLSLYQCRGKEGFPSGISRNGDEHFQGGASDSIVTLAGWEKNLKPGEVSLARAGTFMHELGHNLGLGHGGLIQDDQANVIGVEHTNWKPNHLSVMNYFFQDRGLLKKNFLGFFRYGNLDYSRFGPSDLPNLIETNLSEPDGFRAGNTVRNYGTLYYCIQPSKTITVKGLQQAVDWNCDGDKIDTNVNADINQDEGTILTTINEWQWLRYNGGAIGAFGTTVDLPTVTSMEMSPELTFEQDQAIGPFVSLTNDIFLPVILKN